MFISAAFPPVYTGIGAYTNNMALALAKNGNQVVVATCRTEGQSEYEMSNAGTILRCFSWRELRTKQLAQRLLKIACEHQVDIIESADFLGEAGPLLRLKRSIPVCIKAHNSGPVRIGRESEIFHFWQRWMQWGAILRNGQQYREEKYSIENGDLLVTPSARLMSELEKQGLDLPRYRFVQPNPVCLSLEEQFEDQEEAKPTILFVGRLAIGKGIAFLPGIMEKLVPVFPDIRLVIAGSDSYARGLGSLRKWLEKRFGKISKNIEFTGQLGREELTNWYKKAWMVLVPSIWDTFPTVILEAMSHAKPVAGSLNGGIPEMLQDTHCKAIAPGSDAFVEEIKKLLKNKSLRRKAGKSMLEKAQKDYSLEVVAKSYIQNIEKYLKE